MSVPIPFFKVAIVSVICLFAGCGGEAVNDLQVAPVKGRVLCNGQPVASGMVIFSPVGSGSMTGKDATGTIESNGAFVLATYKPGDGAAIGKHKVSAGSDNPDQPWMCELANPIEVEVKPNHNEFVIELQADGSGKISTTGK